MEDRTQGGMPCTEFEALLAEAVDGVLSGSGMNQFRAHAQACGKCGPLFAEALTGREWLRSLEAAEPPAHMVRNILLATTGVGAESESGAREGWGSRVRRWTQSLGVPGLGVVFQPRFAMSFGMAFFSVSLMLNVAGVSLRDVRLADLNPSNLERNALEQYYETSARIERYYDNLRLVRELEARVRAIHNATSQPTDSPANEKAAPQKQQPAPKEDDPNTTGAPKTQEERYSQEGLPEVLAQSFDAPTHPNPEGRESQA